MLISHPDGHRYDNFQIRRWLIEYQCAIQAFARVLLIFSCHLAFSFGAFKTRIKLPPLMNINTVHLFVCMSRACKQLVRGSIVGEVLLLQCAHWGDRLDRPRKCKTKAAAKAEAKPTASASRIFLFFFIFFRRQWQWQRLRWQ